MSYKERLANLHYSIKWYKDGNIEQSVMEAKRSKESLEIALNVLKSIKIIYRGGKYDRTNR